MSDLAMDLQILSGLAALLRDRDLKRLAEIDRARTQLARQRSQLVLAAIARGKQLANMTVADAALFAGQDDRWLDHLERKREALIQEEALLMSERELVLALARRSLGRTEALEKLSARNASSTGGA